MKPILRNRSRLVVAAALAVCLALLIAVWAMGAAGRGGADEKGQSATPAESHVPATVSPEQAGISAFVASSPGAMATAVPPEASAALSADSPITGTTSAPGTTAESVSEEKPTEELWDPNRQSQVIITLAEEPEVGVQRWERAAITVAEGTTTYVMRFKEPMNRTSVEETLRVNTANFRYPYESPAANPPIPSFNWRSDREVQITVDAAEGGHFALDVRKAKTVKGRTLAETAVLDVMVVNPGQLWRVSLDGKKREKLAELTRPYSFRTDTTRGAVFAIRYTQVCECDAPLRRLFSVMDSETGALTRYEKDLYTSYQGEGAFIADTRGFFYEATAKESRLGANGQTAFPVAVDGHVFGTGFNRDRSLLLIAAGEKAEPGMVPLDLLVLRVKDGSITRLKGALRGVLEENPLRGGYEPIRFIPSGKLMETTLAATAERDGRFYAFDFAAGGTVIRQRPARDAYPVGFSDDGQFSNYNDGSLYSVDPPAELSLTMTNWSMWIPGTHKFLATTGASGEGGDTLWMGDADTGQMTALEHVVIPEHSQLLSISEDGKHVVIKTPGSWDGGR